eukprot:4327088-Pyramimonas_sp.AAC.1
MVQRARRQFAPSPDLAPPPMHAPTVFSKRLPCLSRSRSYLCWAPYLTVMAARMVTTLTALRTLNNTTTPNH